MIYIFRGANEYVKLRLTNDRRIEISNKLTDGKFIELKPHLFGRNRDKRLQCSILISKIPRLSAHEVDVYLVIEFAKMGYELIRKGDKKVSSKDAIRNAEQGSK